MLRQLVPEGMIHNIDGARGRHIVRSFNVGGLAVGSASVAATACCSWYSRTGFTCMPTVHASSCRDAGRRGAAFDIRPESIGMRCCRREIDHRTGGK